MTSERQKYLRDLTGDEALVIVDYLPDPFTQVRIHCEIYSCLGYLDQTCIWRNCFTKEPIDSKVFGWEPI